VDVLYQCVLAKDFFGWRNKACSALPDFGMQVQDPAALPPQLMPVSTDVQEVAPNSAPNSQDLPKVGHPQGGQHSPASNTDLGGDQQVATAPSSSGGIAQHFGIGSHHTSQGNDRMETSAGPQLSDPVLGAFAQPHVPAVAPPAIRMAKPGGMRSILGKKAGASAMAAALSRKKGEAALGFPPQVTALRLPAAHAALLMMISEERAVQTGGGQHKNLTATIHVQEASGKATADVLRSQFLVAYPSLPVAAAEVQPNAAPGPGPGPGVDTQKEEVAQPSHVSGADVR
jgi:hypothetical protein